MSQRAICLYLHVHQPLRIRRYSIFDAGVDSNYWQETEPGIRSNNEFIIRKVAEKSYRPTNAVLQRLLERHPDFKVSFSITGTLIEQLEMWAPDVLDDFKRLVASGRVEIVGETYYHSLAFFFSRPEFERQVAKHSQKIHEVFGVTPKVLRNTELSYNNDLAAWADQAGYKGILTEGWDPILGWRSPNFVYRPAYTQNIRLLMKNYRLSDDIAFRFSDRNWSEWPLTTDKFVHWVNEQPAGSQIINLFMDYETFGEHQWADSGTFDFLEHLPQEFLRTFGNTFMTPSEAIDTFEPADTIDVPHTITWADTERDLTAWLGNAMQQNALNDLYAMEHDVLATDDPSIIDDWRRMQTSDHVYYMCTKWANDGDVHAYFSAYDSPYDAFLYFCNAVRDLKLRVLDAHNNKGGKNGSANRT